MTEARTDFTGTDSAGRSSDVYLDVKVYGGSDIAKVCRDMVALADRMGITIWADLNDVRTLARPGDDGHALWLAWQEAARSKVAYKRASTG